MACPAFGGTVLRSKAVNNVNLSACLSMQRLSYARSKSHAYARYRGEVPGAATEEKKKQPREKRKATDDGGEQVAMFFLF